MRLPHLLDQEPVLDGAHAAQIRVRPFRLAYIIPDDNPMTVTQVIASCSLQWGGYFHLIIPASMSDGIAPHWRDMLRVGDPDLIVDTVGLASEHVEGLKAEGWSIHRWATEEVPLYINGSLLYAGVHAETRMHNETSFPPEYILVDPQIDAIHEFYLPAIARYGLLREDEAREARRLHGWAEAVRIEQLIRRVEVDLTKQIDAILGGAISLPVEEFSGGVLHTITLPHLAAAMIHAQAPSYALSTIDIDRSKYDAGFLVTIVVTGLPNSISDLALYWNIRAERTGADPFPLWIPIDYLDTDSGARIVAQALTIAKFRSGDLPFPESRLQVISSSLSTATLVGRLAERFPEAHIRSENLSDFVAQRVTRAAATEEREVHFSDGSARVALPRPAFVDHFGRHDRVMLEIEFNRARLLGRQQLAVYRSRGEVSMTATITRSGRHYLGLHHCSVLAVLGSSCDPRWLAGPRPILSIEGVRHPDVGQSLN